MLTVHRSERADALTEPLAALLADPPAALRAEAPADPFTPDVVAVPTRGVERWLAQRLSHRLGAGTDGEAGVCANVLFPSPAALVADALAPFSDVADDPWDADRLVWPLIEVLDEHAGEPWCETLGRHLGVGDADGSHRRTRRFAVARHLATLFAAYGSQRPELPVAWAHGDDVDGAGGTVPHDLRWQPELWRRLRDRVDVPSPAERLGEALARLRQDPGAVPLPGRLSVFGPTRLPEQHLRVLDALAQHRDVHLWLPHPSPALWAATSPPSSRRRSDRTPGARHPLLASMARDATELQLRLTALGPGADRHHPAADLPDTLLGRLQTQLREDAPPPAPGTLASDDRSVQVHACHGRPRQVEVLREVLLQLFAADDSLEPRDVLVMCPDIETFAPLVSATFGLAPDDPGASAATHPGHRLRVRLADRSLRQTNPVLGLLSQLLEMADGRVTASEVLDVAASEPVRRRFSLDDDDVDRLRSWAVAAGARWGEDLPRRTRFELGHVGQGTWQGALDRVLVGAAMAEEDERWIGSALPLDDVDSTDIDLAGRLAELLDRLGTVLADLDGVRPLPGWLDALDRALDRLAHSGPGSDDAWQGVQARRVLADVREAGLRQGDVPLRLPDVRALLAGRLQGRPTRANFRTGHLTMCSLVPMRSVPHRVVCLLGMDDGAFPRGTGRDGDDLLLREPLLGERDRRSEDRQLFLDAVMAAGDHLVVLHSGADERTGAHRAPAVPVGEVLDALDRTARTADGRPAREHVVVRHPLQPFDARNFTPGRLGVPGPASFDTAALAGAVAARQPRRPRGPFLPRRLPPAVEETIDLDDLVRFLEHPAKELLRRRLGVALPFEEDDVSDRLPLQLDALEAWKVGDRLLAARLAGADAERSRLAERRRGEVPPNQLGRTVLAEIQAKVEPLATLAAAHSAAARRAVDVVVDLPDGRPLSGTLTVHGTTVVRAAYSTLAAKHRVRAWVQLLALATAHPRTSWSAVTVGRVGGRSPAARQSVLVAPDEATAGAALLELVDLRDRGLREPLPMPVAAAASYADARRGGNDEVQALDSALRLWKNQFAGSLDAYHALVWGPDAPFETLLGAAPPQEQRWWPDEASRFGVLARRVWAPLLDAEELTSP